MLFLLLETWLKTQHLNDVEIMSEWETQLHVHVDQFPHSQGSCESNQDTTSHELSLFPARQNRFISSLYFTFEGTNSETLTHSPRVNRTGSTISWQSQGSGGRWKQDYRIKLASTFLRYSFTEYVIKNVYLNFQFFP